MWYSETQNSVIKTPRALTVDGIQHPSAIFRTWSSEELEAIGVYSVEMVTPDMRYVDTGAEIFTKKDRRKPDGTYAGGADYYELTYATTEKNVDDLKTNLIAKIKTNVGVLLATSDWRVIREADGGTAVSDDWKTYRNEVRAHGNSLESGVEAFASVEAVRNFQNHAVQEERKVSTYDSEGVETIGPETETVNRTVDKTYWGWPTAPDAKVDPYHVRYL